jgi:predicted amidohydrolase YtcJ
MFDRSTDRFLVYWRMLCIAACSTVPVICGAATQKADFALIDARIYTSAVTPPAQSLAVLNGRLVYVGSTVGAQAYIGPKTRIERGDGRLVIPGLVDAHVHPVDIIDLDVRDLDSKPYDLRELSAFVKGCLDHYKTPVGHRLLVHQWNFDGRILLHPECVLSAQPSAD